MALGYQSMVNITADKLLRMMMFSLKFGESFGRFSISVFSEMQGDHAPPRVVVSLRWVPCSKKERRYYSWLASALCIFPTNIFLSTNWPTTQQTQLAIIMTMYWNTSIWTRWVWCGLLAIGYQWNCLVNRMRTMLLMMPLCIQINDYLIT